MPLKHFARRAVYRYARRVQRLRKRSRGIGFTQAWLKRADEPALAEALAPNVLNDAPLPDRLPMTLALGLVTDVDRDTTAMLSSSQSRLSQMPAPALAAQARPLFIQ